MNTQVRTVTTPYAARVLLEGISTRQRRARLDLWTTVSAALDAATHDDPEDSVLASEESMHTHLDELDSLRKVLDEAVRMYRRELRQCWETTEGIRKFVRVEAA